ncbi:unnamed protein product [Choristocarpus tenellus]
MLAFVLCCLVGVLVDMVLVFPNCRMDGVSRKGCVLESGDGRGGRGECSYWLNKEDLQEVESSSIGIGISLVSLFYVLNDPPSEECFCCQNSLPSLKSCTFDFDKVHKVTECNGHH